MYSFAFRVFYIAFLWGGFAFALPYAPEHGKNAKSSRSANTCADPSLAETVFQSFIPTETVHALNYRYAFEAVNTQSQAILWGDLQPAFRAWPTQQNFTVPLFQLGTADRMQYIYRTGVDAQTPPVISGFNTDVFVVGWVYDSQVCGSIPLMSAAQATFTDHYYTISAFEHDRIVSSGWADDGVVAFVLPLYNS